MTKILKRNRVEFIHKLLIFNFFSILMLIVYAP